MRVADSFKRFLPLLFGYDVFISYRRRDASSYVNALAAALHEVGFVCFLDREETVGGVELAPALKVPSAAVAQWLRFLRRVFWSLPG